MNDNVYISNIKETLFSPIGQVILHNTLPNEFELYLIALQVVDDDNNEIIDYLVFPVNPSSVMQVQKTFTNIKKTFNAVHINENNTFPVCPINMNGNFGRNFKFVISHKKTIPLKTGYGTVKYLSNLIKTSKGNNSKGRPYRTILYNLVFGDIYTVEIMDCKFSQTQNENKIWNYDLSMMIVAPGDIGNTTLNFKIEHLIGFNSVKKIMNEFVKNF